MRVVGTFEGDMREGVQIVGTFEGDIREGVQIVDARPGKKEQELVENVRTAGKAVNKLEM